MWRNHIKQYVRRVSIIYDCHELMPERLNIWHRWQALAHEWPWQWLNMVMDGIGGGRMLMDDLGSGPSRGVP